MALDQGMWFAITPEMVSEQESGIMERIMGFALKELLSQIEHDAQVVELASLLKRIRAIYNLTSVPSKIPKILSD